MKQTILFLGTLILFGVLGFADDISFQTRYLELTISSDGQTTGFIDRASGTNFLKSGREQRFALLTEVKGKSPIVPKSVTKTPAGLAIEFLNGSKADLTVVEKDKYLEFRLESVTGSFYKIEFARAFVDIDYKQSASFGATNAILSINTKTLAFPGKSQTLGAVAYQSIGAENAAVALVGCPQTELRPVLKEIVQTLDPKEIPLNPAGGPFAMDVPRNFGSYIITSNAITAENAKAWADFLRPFGVNQIDFHQGVPFRQADFVFNEKAYPNDVTDFRKMTDVLRQEGFTAGLHTYSEFINPASRYITPVPHPDLDVMETFTLSADLDDKATEFAVDESTADVSTITGFTIRNSLYVRIGNELIRFGSPYSEGKNGFEKCVRGAYGTKIEAHKKGDKVEHLTQYFNLFAPRPDSELFLEIARNTAKTYNEGGFGMIYLDALDGTNALLADKELVWYYDALFVREIMRNVDLANAPLLEYSTMHTSLWSARSRMGAWDSPSKGYQRFFDLHFASNYQSADSTFLPGQIGWFALCPEANGTDDAPAFQFHTMFPEELEYLGAKALGRNYGFSFLDLRNMDNPAPGVVRNGQILERFNRLRMAQYFPNSVLRQLNEPGKRFSLVPADGKNWDGPDWKILPAAYEKLSAEESKASGKIENPFAVQKPMIRIENRLNARNPASKEQNQAATDQPEKLELIAFDENQTPKELTEQKWETPLNLTKQLAMGMEIFGDGQKQVVNVQVGSPYNLTSGHNDHFVVVDWTGWKFVRFIEAENGQFEEIRWPVPCGGIYREYRERVHYKQVNRVSVMVHGPTDGLKFRPLYAIPIEPTDLVRPSVSANGQTITFDGSLKPGEYLEFSPTDSAAAVWTVKNEKMDRTIPVLGSAPVFNSGSNDVQISADSSDSALPPRYRATFKFVGDALK